MLHLFPQLQRFEMPETRTSAKLSLESMFAMTGDADNELVRRYGNRAAATDGSCEAVLRAAMAVTDEIEVERSRGKHHPAATVTQCRPIIEWAGVLGIRKAGGLEGMWTAWERADGLVAFEANDCNDGIAQGSPVNHGRSSDPGGELATPQA